eukprot:1188992-Prorocentrum_minimum.AAC.1
MPSLGGASSAWSSGRNATRPPPVASKQGVQTHSSLLMSSAEGIETLAPVVQKFDDEDELLLAMSRILRGFAEFDSWWVGSVWAPNEPSQPLTPLIRHPGGPPRQGVHKGVYFGRPWKKWGEH